MLAVFAGFALRSFCWLVYFDGDHVEIGSPNNLGDLSMHLQQVRFFAGGAPWWPATPEAAGETLRYYPGINLFHALLSCVGLDDLRVCVWMGLVGSAAAALALYRWGGSFTLAGFLFSGGLAGWQFFGTASSTTRPISAGRACRSPSSSRSARSSTRCPPGCSC